MQMVSIGYDDTLLYGYRSFVWEGFAHYGESLAAHSFLQRVHNCLPMSLEGSRYISPSYAYDKSQQMFLVIVWFLCSKYFVDYVYHAGC